jgi:hypothetical protein
MGQALTESFHSLYQEKLKRPREADLDFNSKISNLQLCSSTSSGAWDRIIRFPDHHELRRRRRHAKTCGKDLKPMLGRSLRGSFLLTRCISMPSVVTLFFHNDDALVIAWIYIRPFSELSCRERSRASGVIDARFLAENTSTPSSLGA